MIQHTLENLVVIFMQPILLPEHLENLVTTVTCKVFLIQKTLYIRFKFLQREFAYLLVCNVLVVYNMPLIYVNYNRKYRPHCHKHCS